MITTKWYGSRSRLNINFNIFSNFGWIKVTLIDNSLNLKQSSKNIMAALEY